MGTITGYVDSGSGPGRGVAVSVIEATAEHPDLAARTDEDGRYALNGLQAGTYCLRAGSAVRQVVVSDCDEVVSCDFRLERGPRPGVSVSPGAVENTSGGQEDAVEGDLIEDFPADPYSRNYEVLETTEAGGPSLSLTDRGLIYATLSLELARGNRDPDSMTDAAWAALNPLEDIPISTADPDYDAKAAEWLLIRSDFVLPLLEETRPASGGAAAVGSLPLVNTPMTKGPTHVVRSTQRSFGLPETIRSIEAVAAEWHRHGTGTLHILDVSKEGGGPFSPPHRSHQVGCDYDIRLRFGRNWMAMSHPNYASQRPVVQELVDVIHEASVLPVKMIGFTDPQIERTSKWSGHDKHLHVRLRAPRDKLAAINEFVARSYADRPPNKRPRYD